MRRFLSSLRISIFFACAVGIYATLRWWANTAHSPARFPDSFGYSHLQFFGPNDRLWSVPFFYSLVHSDHQRVLLQILVGVCVWGYLAWILSSVTRWRKSIAVATLCVGLTPQVMRFDIAILSESLGISFAVLAVALSIQLSRSNSALLRWAWLVAIMFTAFTRPVHLLVVFVLSAYFLFSYLTSRRKRNKANAILFTVLSVWGLMQLRGNQSESTLNFYTVLQKRICPNHDMYQWFVNRGMPNVDGLCAAKQYAYSYDLPNDLGAILQLPEGQNPPQTMLVGGIPLAQWVVHHGWSTYTQYVVSHPAIASHVATTYATRTLDAPDNSVLSLDSRNVLPSEILRPWWLWFGVLIAACVYAAMRKQSAQSARIVGLITVLVASTYLAALLTSAVELERHAVTTSVLLRVLTLAALAIATQSATSPNGENVDEPAQRPSRVGDYSAHRARK